MFTDEEIFEEFKKLLYFYGLKHEIRYGEKRGDLTESVAEHIYGMQILAVYFLQLEDTAHTWNWERIFQMIPWHDMDELETGDIIGYKKTAADKAKEKDALHIVIQNIPDVLREHAQGLLMEYENQKTIEARFVKALDRIEPLFQLYNDNGKTLQLRNKTTMEDHRRIKDSYVAEFPYLAQLNDVVNAKMLQEGFFAHSA